ncbi:unnamed protein product [Caenorhabditis nigoni]
MPTSKPKDSWMHAMAKILENFSNFPYGILVGGGPLGGGPDGGGPDGFGTFGGGPFGGAFGLFSELSEGFAFTVLHKTRRSVRNLKYILEFEILVRRQNLD